MMNRGNMNAARKVVRQDIDEESLILFREMHKHEKDEVASLLLPVSEELESHDAGGGYGLYRVTSGRKNDYDWLKTPPATPLFPSLEMEANPPSALLIQRELPIVQPLLPSRFSDNSKATRTITARSPSPSPKTTKISPANLAAPHRKSSTRSSVVPAALNLKLNKSNNGAVAGEKWNTTLSSSSLNVSSAKSGVVKNKESSLNLLASNLSKSLGPMDSSSSTNKQPRSRGVSPLVRSKIPAPFPGFSDETPPNLRTDRSVSAARGRSASAAAVVDHQHKEQNQTITQNQRPSSVSRTRRQSCSPSVARGRKTPQVTEGNTNTEAMQQKVINTRIMQHGNPQVLGSRMVDKFLNARKASSIQEGINVNDNKAGKVLNGSINETSGFGRMMSRNSLNMALKHMEIKQIDSNKVGKNGIMPVARKSTSNMRGSVISSRPTSNGDTFL